MTPIGKNGRANFSRLAASLSSPVVSFAGSFLSPLLCRAAGVGLLGSLFARRQGKWLVLVDWLLIYASLFLLPPGLLGWTISIFWLIVGLALATGGGCLARRLAETRSAFFKAFLIILALTASTAFLNVLRFRPRPMPEHWAGKIAALNDEGSTGAIPAPTSTEFFSPFRKRGRAMNTAPIAIRPLPPFSG
jgi:hypothetical protein